MCLGLFTLHSPAGVLSGVICLDVDDMLGTGDELFESKLKELDKLVGFGFGFGSMKRQTNRSQREAVRKTCQWRNRDFNESVHPGRLA